MKKALNQNESFIFFGIKSDNQDQKFVVEATKIKEILQVPTITKLPMSSKEMLGIIDLRGEVVPVFDLNVFLLKEKDNQKIKSTSIIMVFENENKKYGFVVDYAKDMVEAKNTKIFENEINGLSGSYVEYFVEKDNDLCIKLNFEKIIKKISG